MYSRTVQEDGSLIATLALDARAEEIRDQVVASFVFLERERRARQRGTENRALGVMTGQVALGTDFPSGLALR